MMSLRDHPNVVRCDDFKVYRIADEDNWDIQIKMEKLTSLQARMKEGPLSEEEVVRLGQDVCEALIACGQYHLIHRDIKPANLFLDRWGHCKLGDFGTARAQGSGSNMTQKAGTELYMAPEVLRGGTTTSGWTSTRWAWFCTSLPTGTACPSTPRRRRSPSGSWKRPGRSACAGMNCPRRSMRAPRWPK